MRLDIHHHHHYPKDADDGDIAAISHIILNMLEQVMHTLEETLALVTDQKTRIDSLVALTTDLHQKVIDALGASLTPSQQMRVDAIFDAVKNNADEVDAAITANTVSASAGAVSDGPSASDIKADISSQSPNSSVDGVASTTTAAVDGSPAV
jgi:hypothetical protein